MQCPFCGGPMEKGALDAGKGPLQYINRKHNRIIGFLCDTTAGEIDLANSWSGSARVPAYKCAACKKIMIDYSGAAERDPDFFELIKELKK
ncbi:MAG: hypothetical protein IJK89_07185 [Clostridia bacterium]|nr:hypothetical protein [Clostridia bacterium]